MDNRRCIARRAAQYFNEGDTVNLGIGIPSACSDYVDPTIAFQTENGMIGVGPVAKKLAICDTYQNAGGINFVPVMGASAFDTAYSFAVIRSGRMGLYSLLRREMQIWQSFEKLFDKTFRQSWKISAVFGAKKQETFSDFLSWYAAVTGGGYSVVIPRKQTCSPYLKRFLCKWACGCPTLFFSAGCKSHLQRLTGSFHFPCSKRLQIFVSV